MKRLTGRWRRCLFLCLTVAAGPASAQTAPRHLTLTEARHIALTQHPRISVASLVALAAREATRESRAGFFPNIYGSATAVDNTDPNNTRITADGLNNPIIYEREAEGLTISQLITDFGRTWELTQSAKWRARGQEMNLEATREQILMEVDNAFFSSLAAQSVVSVASQTVQSRALVFQQTQALATNKMRSSLDVSFAMVDLDQTKIILAKAESDLKASFAVLRELLAERGPESFVLVDEPMPAAVTNNDSALIMEALANRPDLARLRDESKASSEFARAEEKLIYPTLSALGTAGVTPTGNAHLGPDYLAAGVNLNVPIYTGGLYSARRRAAEDQAKAADETLRDAEDIVIRDVQVTKLNLDYAFQRLALTRQLLENANQALDLAQARFKNGISSIVELSQAELNQTQAEFAAADARYDYQTQYSALLFQLGRLR